MPHSRRNSTPPVVTVMRVSLLDCLRDNGTVDVERCLEYFNRNRERDQLLLDYALMEPESFLSGGESDDEPPIHDREQRTRARRIVYGRKDSEDGPLVLIPPHESLWYKMYVSNFYLIENQKMQSKFRARFRIPYDNFRELVHWVTIDPLFERWCGKKCNNKRSSPVELLVLGSLRYLGRGWTFDDIEEATAISKEVH